ncbi:hypothetical protein BAZO_07824 [Schinkia azotoformans LMG 9581]|uniref:Uncharacterized protein n=1 Tax=Schinkia azotoformans LMG 9581 TaxID=1131731 RepID=K6DI32_SCHAZ|nr:hypothetical protein BAZO_07824 [Schinkia azotoformans LMG 9581]
MKNTAMPRERPTPVRNVEKPSFDLHSLFTALLGSVVLRYINFYYFKKVIASPQWLLEICRGMLG